MGFLWVRSIKFPILWKECDEWFHIGNFSETVEDLVYILIFIVSTKNPRSLAWDSKGKI
jgi:hypothetical protein